MSQRFAACVEYSGIRYNGWQRQSHAPSVQQELEQAISQVANESVSTICSGRTDTGVHGIGQVIHFDSGSERSINEWLRGINTYLPHDISVAWIHPVDATFHARFAAKSRSYRYIVLNRDIAPSYLHGLVTWHRLPLNESLMSHAARALLGKHDYSAFRASGCQSKSPVKQVTYIDIQRSGQWVWLDITADGFLHHMVRNIMGVLMKIGEGGESAEWAEAVLKSKNRKQGGITAPAHGLYFAKVIYDDDYQLPKSPEICQFW